MTNPEHPKPQHQSFLKHWGSLVVLSLALAIIVIDTTLLNVSLTTIINDLKTDIQHLQWVITAYALTLAALTITGGRLGDFFGRKKMFILGAILFAIGSLTASYSTNFVTLLLGESLIEGIGAALMMPATASLLVNNFHGRDRAIAFGVWGGIAGAAAAIGPVLGGYLTAHYSWRWGFRINVFVVLILLAFSYLVKEAKGEKKKITLDITGVFLSAFGLLSVVFGIIESTTYGWWQAKETFTVYGHAITFGNLSVTPISMLIGAILLTIFFWWENVVEAKGKTPLISMHIFANKAFSAGLVTVSVISLGMSGIFLAIPIFLQTVRGMDSLQTGYALLPMSLALLIVSPIGAVLSHKVLPKYLVQAGLLLNVVALFYFNRLFGPDTTAAQLIAPLAIYGVGMGLVMSQINNIILSALPVQYAGEASGINSTMRQLGSTLGSAIIGAVIISSLSSHITSGIQNSTVIPTAAKPQIIAQAAAEGSNIEFAGPSKVNSTTSPVIATEMTSISHNAIAQSDVDATLYTIGFGILGFVLSFLLPSERPKTHGPAEKQPAAGH